MTNDINFDALARKSNESGGAVEDLNNLFGSAFALQEWLFIARGELPNISPYIAARADFMNGQNMIRAFTDSNYLLRFAKENNLTNADGGAEMLTIPTSGIVEYLEQFIKYGNIAGVWFNSDSESDGFSIPLTQLRPIKAHLTKIGWKSINEPTNSDLPHNSGFVPAANLQNSGGQQTSSATVFVNVSDGLMLPSGFVKESSYACIFYCRVPHDWTENGKLKDAYLEKLFEKVYGENWRAGNSDGSRYVVRKSFSNILNSEDARNANWTASANTDKYHFWYYIASADGEIRNVTPAEFQKDVDASPPASAPTPQTSNLENWGFNYVTPGGDKIINAAHAPRPSGFERWGFYVTPDDGADGNVKIFSPGSVKFDASILPFYAAVTPLLRDYKGSGEYAQIFAFASEAMTELTENIMSNQHGAYFRVRRFQYAPPNRGAAADAATIDSNQMRHVQTGATLTISFTLLKIAAASSASLYFGFQGSRSEVEKLLNAVTPALESAEFVAEKKTQ